MLNSITAVKQLNKGFTFIEILVSIAVITIALVAVIQLFPVGSKVGKNAEQNSSAITLAQAKMEELIAENYDDLVVGTLENHQQLSADPLNNLSAFWRTTQIFYVDSNLNVIGIDNGLKKITVTVFWRNPFSPDTEKSVTITNLFGQRWKIKITT